MFFLETSSGFFKVTICTNINSKFTPLPRVNTLYSNCREQQYPSGSNFTSHL